MILCLLVCSVMGIRVNKLLLDGEVGLSRYEFMSMMRNHNEVILV